MDFQPLFRRFHEAIQLSYNGSAELRQMRDEVLNVLRQRLDKRFTTFNQGSYEVGTGIKPPPGSDFDLDIGVVFALEPSRYKVQEVKEWVRVAVHSLGTIEWKRPCITVQRKRHHLDIAVFVEHGGQRYLALGKQNEQDSRWQPDGLKEFMDNVAQRFPGSPDDSYQFRRTVRYLKRWKDQHFPRDGKSAPTGCALTVAAYKWFRPRRSGTEQNDLGALETLVQEMTKQLTASRKLTFPEKPHDDVLRKMSDEQIKQLVQRLGQLALWLAEAQKLGSVAPLQKAFGADFPAP